MKFDCQAQPYKMLYKTDYDEPFKTVELQKPFQRRCQTRLQKRNHVLKSSSSSANPAKSLVNLPLVQRYKEPPRISDDKYKDLMCLCNNNIIKPTYHQFYRSLIPEQKDDNNSDTDIEPC